MSSIEDPRPAKAPRPAGAMSVDSFVRWASIGRSTTWNEIRLGRLQANKVNAGTLITCDDAQAWLSSHQAEHEISSQSHRSA